MFFPVIKETFQGAGFLYCMSSILAALLIFNSIWKWWEACELPNRILRSEERERTWTQNLCFWPCRDDFFLDFSKALSPLLLLNQWILKVNFHLSVLQFQIQTIFFFKRIESSSDLRKLYLSVFGKCIRDKKAKLLTKGQLDKTNTNGNFENPEWSTHVGTLSYRQLEFDEKKKSNSYLTMTLRCFSIEFPAHSLLLLLLIFYSPYILPRHLLL